MHFSFLGGGGGGALINFSYLLEKKQILEEASVGTIIKILLVRVRNGTNFCLRLRRWPHIMTHLNRFYPGTAQDIYSQETPGRSSSYKERLFWYWEEARLEEKKAFEIERKQLLPHHSSLSEIHTSPPHQEREQLLHHRLTENSTQPERFCGEVKRRPRNGRHRVIHHFLQDNVVWARPS